MASIVFKSRLVCSKYDMEASSGGKNAAVAPYSENEKNVEYLVSK